MTFLVVVLMSSWVLVFEQVFISWRAGRKIALKAADGSGK
jgi:hypothetical protein